MHLYEQVNEAVADALSHWGEFDEMRTKPATLPGFDFQFPIMGLAKKKNLNPKELGERVATLLAANPLFSDATVSGPGFVNLKIADDTVIETAKKAAIGSLAVDNPQSFLIDFGGPNIAKALHVGHLRSLVIGESLRRILQTRGHKVVSDIHFGDWGLPMGMLISQLKLEDIQNMEPLVLARKMEDLYPNIVASCKDNPLLMEAAHQAMLALQRLDKDAIEVWKLLRAASMQSMAPHVNRLGALFDYLNGESDSAMYIATLEQQIADQIHMDNGAAIIHVAQDDKKPMPPIMWRKADGGYTYATTDLATILYRSHYQHDHLLYVVDNRQTLHFEQVFRAASHFYSGKMTHAGFGTVNGPDGKPFKTRDGGVPSLEWMLDAAVAKASERISDPTIAEKVGLGAIKFADLITNRNSGYVFDLDRMLNPEGKTGTYLQYACVRVAKIVNTAAKARQPNPKVIQITHPAERDLLLACANMPEAIASAEHTFMPSFVAEYAFGLAQTFSKFYENCPVIGSPEEESRLAICNLTALVLMRCTYLLGIEIPDQM